MAFFFTEENLISLMKKEPIPRYSQQYSVDLVFAADLVSHVMKLESLPFISAAYAPCTGVPPDSPLTPCMKGVIMLMNTYAKNTRYFTNISAEEPEKMTYERVQRELRYTMHSRTQDVVFPGLDALYYPTLLSGICAIAYGKGLKKAPHMAVTAIRFLMWELKMSGDITIDFWEGINASALSLVSLYVL